MFDSIIAFFTSSPTQLFTSWIGILLYWVPVGICAVGYFLRIVVEYRSDLDERSSATYYIPDLTLGVILGRVVLTMVPIVNLFVTIFSWMPQIIGWICSWMEATFQLPLVPDTLVHKLERKQRNSQPTQE